ncbi:hypothetical protein F9K80_23490 [Brucella intermedia]|nr:hypothetical protein F9K80_23490 [Brucella intermedia]
MSRWASIRSIPSASSATASISNEVDAHCLFVFTHVLTALQRHQRSVRRTDFPAKTVPTFGRHAFSIAISSRSADFRNRVGSPVKA